MMFVPPLLHVLLIEGYILQSQGLRHIVDLPGYDLQVDRLQVGRYQILLDPVDVRKLVTFGVDLVVVGVPLVDRGNPGLYLDRNIGA